MRRALAIVTIALGCTGKAKCKEAVRHLGGSELGKIATVCVEDRWTDAQLACIGRAPSWLEVDYCSLTDDQRVHLAQARAGADPVGAAKAAVGRYVDAYRPWHADHANTICPPILQELQRYTPIEMTDPWGHDYVMLCGADLPPGVDQGIAVMSAGPDGAEGTADDVKSWE